MRIEESTGNKWIYKWSKMGRNLCTVTFLCTQYMRAHVRSGSVIYTQEKYKRYSFPMENTWDIV